ncbi:MAG TPA: dihydrofolate reductase family protein, partial [Blastocatellia bacterium]
LISDKESEKLMGDFFKTIDVGIMGRKTMELSMKMHGGVYQSGGLETYVFSRTWKPGEHDGFQVVKGSPAALVRRLRKRKGKHIFLMSGELGRAFLQADLVDELYLGIVPVLLGEGIPGFPGGFPQRDFRLVSSQIFAKDSVALIYRRAGRRR